MLEKQYIFVQLFLERLSKHINTVCYSLCLSNFSLIYFFSFSTQNSSSFSPLIPSLVMFSKLLQFNWYQSVFRSRQYAILSCNMTRSAVVGPNAVRLDGLKEQIRVMQEESKKIWNCWKKRWNRMLLRQKNSIMDEFRTLLTGIMNDKGKRGR